MSSTKAELVPESKDRILGCFRVKDLVRLVCWIGLLVNLKCLFVTILWTDDGLPPGLTRNALYPIAFVLALYGIEHLKPEFMLGAMGFFGIDLAISFLTAILHVCRVEFARDFAKKYYVYGEYDKDGASHIAHKLFAFDMILTICAVYVLYRGFEYVRAMKDAKETHLPLVSRKNAAKEADVPVFC